MKVYPPSHRIVGVRVDKVSTQVGAGLLRAPVWSLLDLVENEKNTMGAHGSRYYSLGECFRISLTTH